MAKQSDKNKEPSLKEVVVTVLVTGASGLPTETGYNKQALPSVQAKDFEVELRFGDDAEPSSHWYGDWAATTYQACLHAAKAELDTIGVRFKLGEDESHWVHVYLPANFPNERINGSPMLQVERNLEKMGFEVFSGAVGMWTVHRPDPRDAYSRRGYFDAAQTIRLATSPPEQVAATIRKYWEANLDTSQYLKYLSLKGDRGTMANKKDKAEEASSKQVMAKAIDGTEVALSPKQQEVLGLIKERSGTEAPYGSDPERLSDPESIAAMKLATGEHPVVVRSKFGPRWWYFAKQGDMDRAVKAAEKSAAEAKAATKKPAAEKPAQAAKQAAAGNGSKRSGPLKKPSEK
jgi:hypothetical protein